jgi:prepilin-type N-terminal cleavage/methylation domain-containing protein
MSRTDGFTLIEVLVAALLISLVMLSVATISISAYASVQRGAEETTATNLGLQRIEWLRNQGYGSTHLAPGTTSETLAGTFAGYARSTTVTADTPRTGVKRVTVTTTTPSGGSVEIVTLIVE